MGVIFVAAVFGKVESAVELDEQTCDWIQSSWDSGKALHIISDGLCGLRHFEPWTKRLLPMAWKLFGIWKKLESPNRAPPLTVDMIYGRTTRWPTIKSFSLRSFAQAFSAFSGRVNYFRYAAEIFWLVRNKLSLVCQIRKLGKRKGTGNGHGG